jgi:hypothetical protein
MSYITSRYIVALLLTVGVFYTAYATSNYFNTLRVADLRTMQETMANDLLSLETQWDLLSEVSCDTLKDNPVLSDELGAVGDKLAYAEGQLGAKNEQVLRLKKQYTLLQIKDLLLMRRVSDRCAIKPAFVLYFYSNKDGICDDCVKQGYVLTDLRKEFPTLRVYSFDYDLDLSTLTTLKKIYKLSGELPALVINRTPRYGFQSQDEITTLLPELATLSTTTATSTDTKKKSVVK